MVEPAEKEIKTEKLEFPLRPKASPGWKPKEIILESNHPKLTIKNQKMPVKVYAIAFDPEIATDWRSGVRTLCSSAKKGIEEWLKAPFYTAGRNLFSVSTQEDDKQKNFEVDFKNQKYTINLKKVRETSLSDEVFADNQTSLATRQYLNIVIKKILSRDLKLVEWGHNSKYYDLKNKENIAMYNLSIYQGFKTSCEVYANFTPRLLIDFSSRIIRTDTVLDALKLFKTEEDIRYEFIGRSVVACYANQRMYRITDIAFDLNPLSKFSNDENKEISYSEYYKKKYNITIKDLTQPLLLHVTRDEKKLYLIPELMNMTGLTDEMRRDFRIMKKVAEYTRLEPGDRYQRICDTRDALNKYLEKEGLILEKSSKVKAFRLAPPDIMLGTKSLTPDRGNYQFRDPVKKPANFKDWVIVYHKNNYDDAEGLLNNMKKASGAYGIKVGDCKWIEISETKSAVWGEKITNYMRSNPNTQIVVVLIPPPAKPHVYPVIKQVCNKELGVPSQVIVTTSLQKNTLAVCSKILLQMNAKVGLPIWVTANPAAWGKRKAMMIGVDVFHNIGKLKKSCIGFCATLDDAFTRIFAKIKMQPKAGDEFMPSLANLVREAIMKYLEVNKALPELIIMYRDGVGDTQIPIVMEVETKLIRSMFAKIDPEYKPEFAEIIVKKRIDDRFFASNAKGEVVNPSSGTVVARDVVSNYFDFFLVAQDVNMGSCTPTHYNVVCNETSLTEDLFYELTYRQCYNYYNWNGPVRVPAVLMYAHKLGFLVGQTYKDEHHPRLDDTYFFL